MNCLDVSKESSQDNQERNPSTNNNENAASNPVLQKSSLPYLQADKSNQYIKAAMRSEFLTILSDRKMMREAMRASQELEKKRVMDQWLAVERKAKQKRLKEFLERLSKNQKSFTQEKTQDTIDQNIMSHIEKNKQNQKDRIARIKDRFPSNDNNEYMTRRAELVEREIEQSKGNYERKVRKLEEVQEKRRTLLQNSMQLKREAREKRILRAKVKNIIDQAFGITCLRHKQNAEKNLGDKDNKLLAKPPKSLDELFFAKLNDGELRQVRHC
eukprot:TRINITY_DN5305_c0_g7_i1.p1 TRINITY_DN5305_c0_g7~~TRINITY_DN5305_c0_g7_i1.p1  ORF type:complete len:296 (-),score=88.23 TRINITY_DN5305_c0_g7_i1:893-1705(-)